jgi:hypothetical protein
MQIQRIKKREEVEKNQELLPTVKKVESDSFEARSEIEEAVFKSDFIFTRRDYSIGVHFKRIEKFIRRK